jgi:hypothetical protein
MPPDAAIVIPIRFPTRPITTRLDIYWFRFHIYRTGPVVVGTWSKSTPQEQSTKKPSGYTSSDLAIFCPSVRDGDRRNCGG